MSAVTLPQSAPEPADPGPESGAAMSVRARRIALAIVVAVGAGLRLFAFDSVRLNPFYDAAVRSMGLSWHNFFYGAFEPAGQVSIDKTPADLWLQVASTKLFGFTPTALRLPEVVAGLLAVPLLYDLVRRLFGPRAGLAAAAALAVLPISVVTARSDTMDSLMMLLVLAAAWLVVRAGRTGRPWSLLGAGAVMGLAFNVKLFEAFIALPALLVLALLVSELPWRRRLLELTAAGVVLAAVSVSWLVAVSLSPAAGRPYPIGSTNGSVWNVVFAYNGVDRVKTPPSAAQAQLDPAGVTRLFAESDVHEGRLIGVALLAALAIGAAVGLTALWGRRRGVTSVAPAGTADEGLRVRRAGAVCLGVWLVVGFVLFSRMGRLHPRYLEAFTPAVAATTGAGVAWLAVRASGDRIAGGLLVVATTLAVLLGPHVATKVPFAAVAIAVAAVVATAAFAVHAARVPRPWGAGALTVTALVAVLAIPASAAVHLSGAGTSSSGRPGYAPPHSVASLSRYLIAHQGTARYEVAASAVAKTGPLIVHDGRPVLMLTSLYDRPLLSAAKLAAKVSAGEVRYVLLGRTTCPKRAARCVPVLRWARRHGTDVSRAAGQRTGTLYLLRSRVAR
jgi:4-amino-4-deoxy-L-arabinose transferase-like glycosyltransferase